MAGQKNPTTGFYDVNVDGQIYEFEKWGAEDATDTLLDLSTLLGGPLGEIIKSAFGGKDGMDKEFDPDVIGQIMSALSQRVGEHKLMIKGLIKKLASDRVMCEGKKVNFNLHYQDRLDHMFKVVKAALEVQYGNFFAAILGASGISIPKLGNIMKPGQPISNGASGAP